MEFKPRTEQEIRNSRLLPKGTYDFEVLEASEKLSKSSGKPMIELKLKVFGAAGLTRTITDYLLERMDGKLRHAAEACGLLHKYSKGSLANTDFLRKRGKLQLGIEKDKQKKYPDRNTVADYVTAATAPKGLSAYTR